MKWRLCLLIFFSLVAVTACKHKPFSAEEVVDLPATSDDNNTGGNSDIPCDPDSVYFANTILPLFISNCAKSGCHDAATAQKGIILDSYSNIIVTGEIRPYDPDHGKIVEMITETDLEDRMPPQPNAGLTQEQINQIVQWINQGARNNSCSECDTLNVTYSGKIRSILDGKCVGCHNPSLLNGGVNLANYSGVQTVALNGRLYGAVSHSPGFKPMPYNSNALPQCEVDAIRIWINAGALNN
jgi:hypothetical protein